MSARVELFHYTTMENAAEVLAAAILTPSSSSARRKEPYRREWPGPDVVWFTTAPDWYWGRMERRRMRFAVSVPAEDVRTWTSFAQQWGEAEPGPLAAHERTFWRVLERPVPIEEWVEVHDTWTNDVLWSRERSWVRDGGRGVSASTAVGQATGQSRRSLSDGCGERSRGGQADA